MLHFRMPSREGYRCYRYGAQDQCPDYCPHSDSNCLVVVVVVSIYTNFLVALNSISLNSLLMMCLLLSCHNGFTRVLTLLIPILFALEFFAIRSCILSSA